MRAEAHLVYRVKSTSPLMARFAWKAKTKGGQTAVDSIKATYEAKEVAASIKQIDFMSHNILLEEVKSKAI